MVKSLSGLLTNVNRLWSAKRKLFALVANSMILYGATVWGEGSSGRTIPPKFTGSSETDGP